MESALLSDDDEAAPLLVIEQTLEPRRDPHRPVGVPNLTKQRQIQRRLVARLDELLARFGEALHAERAGMSMTIRDEDVTVFVELVATVRRVEAGTYGFCTQCGDLIGHARLAESSATTLCLECARDQACAVEVPDVSPLLRTS